MVSSKFIYGKGRGTVSKTLKPLGGGGGVLWEGWREGGLSESLGTSQVVHQTSMLALIFFSVWSV